MSKLVDKERLAKLAQGLYNKLNAEIGAEATRALAAEAQALQDAKNYTDAEIVKVNGAATELAGKVTALETFQSEQIQNNEDQLAAINAKVAQSDYTAKMELLDAEDARIAGLVAAEETRAKGVEAGFETRIAANEAFVAAQPAKDEAQDDRIKVLEDDVPVKQAAIEAAQAAADDADAKAEAAQADADALEQRLDAEGGLVDRIEANEADIARLDGAVDVEGSVKKQIKDAIDGVKADVTDGLADRIEDLETFKDTTYPAAEAKVREDFAAADTQIRTDFATADEALSNRIKVFEAGGEQDVVAFKTAQAAKDQEQDDAIAAKVAQSAYDAKVAKLEDEDERIVGLVNAEEQRATAAETALGERIDALVGAEGSIQSQINDAIAQEVIDRNAAIKDEADRAQGVEEDLQEAIDLINDAENGILAQAKAHAETKDADIEARVKANEDKLAVVQGADTVEGSIAKAEKDAKAYADQQIAALVDSAPDAMNTLNELAKAINDNQDVYDAYVEEHAQAMAQQKADLQAEIDADVKVVADELAKQKDAEQEGTLANKIAAEEARALGQEAAIRQELANEKASLQAEIDADVQVEKERAEEAEKALSDRLDVVEAFTEKVEGDISAAIEEALEDKIGHDVDGDNPATGLFLEVDNAQAAAKQAQDEVDAVEGRVDALEAFVEAHDHSVMEQGIADNAAAIEAEVKEGGARDAAIAKALEDYSTTKEVKQILTNVVATLSLTMENNKMMLKLGGAEGVTLAEQSLDMATDDDINEILAELDAE